MDKRKVFIGITIVVVAAAAAWGFGFFGADPVAAELQQLRDQMQNLDLPEAQRDQLRDQFRQRIDSLTDAQRQEYFEASRGQWTQWAEQRLDEFFALAPDAQRQRLDELIGRMLQQRNDRDRNPNTNDRREVRGGGGSLTEAQRDERAKRRLDHSTPKMRAQFDEFRRMLNQRLQARGIDPATLPGRWRGRA
ncbi:MAG: hypothetical protein L0Z07_06950 [Planctomycetes bacterium]|nr:hypothetical protein [Planctomycetota bacterium]